MDIFSRRKRRQIMQSIKSSGSKIETALSKALWKKGHRYRKNCKNILGKPDIVLYKYKLVIFCDSEFWHGKNWKSYKKNIKINKKFWFTKIENTIIRDKYVTKNLRKSGWKVLRFWGKDILCNMDKCVAKIEKCISNVKI